jgi:hypothetical protein|tara:strand:+ start:1069 stop:1440 length:372 start_codon:yes stop_codon:yes gene_type:complete
MSTLKVNNITDTSGGSSNLEVPGSAKVWVNFNGTGTVAIRDDLNVSSITDHGTGDYTVNFTNAMSNANYCTVAACYHETESTNDLRVVTGQTRATNNARINTTYANGSGGYDVPGVNIAVFGD